MISLFCFLFAMDNKIAGNKTKFVIRDMIKVNEIKTPNAAVPPKLDTEKIENPKNKITDV